jgi:hypothetical protein
LVESHDGKLRNNNEFFCVTDSLNQPSEDRISKLNEPQIGKVLQGDGEGVFEWVDLLGQRVARPHDSYNPDFRQLASVSVGTKKQPAA